jgi:hypothetical protein
MRFSGIALTALLSSQFTSAVPTSDDDVALADLAKQAYDKTRQEVTSTTPKRSPHDANTCSLRNCESAANGAPSPKSNAKTTSKP